MIPTELKGQPTGTLKPPRKPNRHYNKRELGKIFDKAEGMCRSSQSDVVIYSDERETISSRVVREVKSMFKSRYILKTFLWSEIKLLPKPERGKHGKSKKKS